MREEETSLCEEMKRRWRRHSGHDEWLDMWKEWGEEGRRDREKGRRTVTTLTASGLVHSLHLWVKFKSDDWESCHRPVTAVHCDFFVCLYIMNILSPSGEGRSVMWADYIPLQQNSPVFTGCVSELKQAIHNEPLLYTRWPSNEHAYQVSPSTLWTVFLWGDNTGWRSFWVS